MTDRVVGGATRAADDPRGVTVRRFGIGTRLTTAFAALLALLAVSAGLALRTIVAGRAAADEVRSLELLTAQAKEIGTRAAALNGWQAGYINDFYRLGPARALAGDSVAYKVWQQEEQRFERFLGTVPEGALSAAERAALGRVRAELATYVAVNERLVATYRPGTSAAMFAGDQLAMYDSWDAYYRIMVAAQHLAASVDARNVAAVAASKRDERRAEWVIGIVAAVALLVAALAAIAVTRSIVRPVARARDALRRVAAHDLTVAPADAGRDEVAQMSAALAQAVGTVRGVVADVTEQARALTVTSGELDAVSGTFAGTIEGTSRQAGAVAGAAEDVSRNVDTMASGAVQMGASIDEIARNATQAVHVADEAVRTAGAANRTVGHLGESSAAIGHAVRLITSIAHQTNLLALNATIEAARAGDAGRGFGVVAGEVKDLAQESARAAEQIDELVRAIQGDTEAAVAAIGQIGEVIGRISEFQTSIAGAVEQQSATTAEMNRGASAASTGTASIAEHIRDIAGATAGAATDVGRARAAASTLRRMSGTLNDAVGQFKL
ncbi:methyl-accepting chemotaxis protein [Dactylosporangium sp. CS-047395]|uniref:methyl-accepting chemotaxis protein n=1 Tax=Dactylosporangium sp. CS-047395 TaxID=3239936 RepID=UPI003D8D0F47